MPPSKATAHRTGPQPLPLVKTIANRTFEQSHKVLTARGSEKLAHCKEDAIRRTDLQIGFYERGKIARCKAAGLSVAVIAG